LWNSSEIFFKKKEENGARRMIPNVYYRFAIAVEDFAFFKILSLQMHYKPEESA
jgi:hypothetical protein